MRREREGRSDGGVFEGEEKRARGGVGVASLPPQVNGGRSYV